MAALLFVLPWLTACGGDDTAPGACADGVQSIAILSPMDGEALTLADDVDPVGGGLQYEFRLSACGFEPDDMIKLVLLDPFETDYAFVTVDDGTVGAIVPLLPGPQRFEARSIDDMVRSEAITIDVTLD